MKRGKIRGNATAISETITVRWYIDYREGANVSSRHLRGPSKPTTGARACIAPGADNSPPAHGSEGNSLGPTASPSSGHRLAAAAAQPTTGARACIASGAHSPLPATLGGLAWLWVDDAYFAALPEPWVSHHGSTEVDGEQRRLRNRACRSVAYRCKYRCMSATTTMVDYNAYN